MSLEKEFLEIAQQNFPHLAMDEQERKDKLNSLPIYILYGPEPKKRGSLFLKLFKVIIIATLLLQFGYLAYLMTLPANVAKVTREFKVYPDYN